MTAIAGEARYSLQNPAKGKKSIKAGWLTEALLMLPNASAPAQPLPDSKPFPFSLGFCSPDPHDVAKPLIQYFVPGGDLHELESTETIVIRFVPNEVGSFNRYLELKWKEKETDDDTKRIIKRFKVAGNAGAPDYARDSRYKLWVYTGYTYLRSQSDFKDGFAELLSRSEIRWIDGRIALKQYHPELYADAVRTGRRCDLPSKSPDNCPTARFSIARIYGEAGLTGTTVVATADPTPGAETKIGGVTQAFGGSIGFGYGQTRLVSVLRDTDTNVFSILGVVRLGIISIPGQKNSTGATIAESRGAFNYSANLRIENEPSFRDDDKKGGNFEGAYFEIGFGESEQFSRKKYPRIRFDGMVPINSGSDLFRFATRLQIDAPRPLATRKIDKADNTKDNLANEIRISVLFNFDLLEFGKRMAGK